MHSIRWMGASRGCAEQLAKLSLELANEPRFVLERALVTRAPDLVERLEESLSLVLDHPGPLVVEHACALMRHFPALGIFVARGAISENRFLDDETLLSAMEDARARRARGSA